MSTLYEKLIQTMGLTPLDLLARDRAGDSETDWLSLAESGEEGACFSFPGDLTKVVEALKQRILSGSKVVIYGDYDVDGLTSVSIVYLTLKLLGVKELGFYIPSRYDTGYGFNRKILERMTDRGYNLLIATDNGITKKRECEYLQSRGIYYVILDHHEEQAGSLPKFGECGLMYHRNDCSAAFLALLVAWRLLNDREFLKRLKDSGFEVGSENEIRKYLDYFQTLAGLAVFSDCMPLDNLCDLALAKRGLKLLNLGLKTPGHPAQRLALLIDKYVAGTPVTFRDINFSINSKLNAVARVYGGNKPNWGVFFLTGEDSRKVESYARAIRQANEEKKELVKRAEELVDPTSKDPVLTIDLSELDPTIPSGLTGLVANAVLRELPKPRPVLVLCRSTIDPTDCIGSLRGPEGMSLDKVLESPFVKPFLKEHGGHEAACGLTVPSALKDDFLERLNQEVEGKAVSEPKPVLLLDEEMVSMESLDSLRALEPFGTGFELPRLALEIDVPRLKNGIRGDHVFVNLRGGGRLVMFSEAEKVSKLECSRVTVEGELNVNTFRGKTTPEFLASLSLD